MRKFFHSIMVAALALGACCPAQSGWQQALASLPAPSATARIVIVDLASGKLLAASRPQETARTLATPGSTLKPLLLYQLIGQSRWNPSRAVACDRALHVAGRALPCSHPPAPPMDAQSALAWSCNSYFAALSDRLQPGDLRALLAPTGLLGRTGLAAEEATALLRDPRTADENRLAVLGLEGVRVTPLELAAAYRWLANEWAAHPTTPATQTVRTGLTNAASLGTGGAAALGGVPVAGKTGTAPAAAGLPTHGWFAGLAPAAAPKVVIVVYLPGAHGADAAAVAGQLLAHSPLRSR